MAIVHYTAKVKDSRLLELPEEAGELLLQPGEEVKVSVVRFENATPTPNKKMLAILQGIQENHKQRPFSDGADTQSLIREARSGAMYGDDPSK